ncbi:MAG: T9SS type A sorting domain-containing protein [Phaeodactylibacter sp.]|nr:T9SS type A sorting domain-containing protein [Phaeodactylibacter sp.]MCB9275662.1 T9SS type A sorting domain-containing protein [Lewinellaceae bacterium]
MVKSVTTFKALLSAFLLFAGMGLYAQCTSATYGQYPSSTYTPANCDGTTYNITTLGYASEYSVVAVVSGNTYTFASSIGTDYITITDSGNSPVSYGTGPIVWAATFSGTVRFYTHLSGCGSSSASRTRTVSCTSAPPPAVDNDVCTTATAITCGWSGSGSTIGATVDPAPSCGGIASSYAGVWYKFTPTPANGMFLNLSSCGQGSLDTKISVYTGSCGNLVCLGSNDNGAGCPNGTSSMTFRPIWNRTHYVLVQSTTPGAFGLTLTCNVTPSFGLAQDVQDDVVSTGKFSVYPNPTQGNLNVGLEPFIGQNATLTVLNSIGQIVFQRDLGEIQVPTQEVNLDNLQSGMYFMTVRTDEGAYTEKFMVNKNRP